MEETTKQLTRTPAHRTTKTHAIYKEKLSLMYIYFILLEVFQNTFFFYIDKFEECVI